jgi:citronellol/citronellal dehydrogenase
LNVDAAWDLTQQVAARWLIPRRSGFIAFLGFSPRRGVPMMIHSSMARSALEVLAAGIALEWSRFGIRAVCVAAGLIQTEGVLAYGGQDLVDAYATQVPLQRPGTADEVAATIAFLASAGAGYITGTTVVVDGGTDVWGAGTAPPPLEA